MRRAARHDTLMAQVRALGHIPREIAGLGDEYWPAKRLQYAKRKNLLSETQLAELAELAAKRMDTLMAQIRALGHIPRRLQYAKSKNLLSESQLAELAELPAFHRCELRAEKPLCSVEPVRKRRRVLNDDV